jgi:hypothetical protein
MTMRGAREHGFYTEETDGTLLDRVAFYWNADYGHLAFTSDHQEIRNCDGMGAGDAAIYPGAAPDTGAQATSFYPDAPRKNTLVTRCDMRNSALGYSGSMGNAVRITRNHIYGNTTGIASDTLSSAGHPGFPADSVQIDHNLIYSNNFNTYAEDSPVDALVTVPMGTGVIFAGMNSARIHDNWFFDNRRFGTMLFAVPDPLTSFGGPEGDVFPGVACPGAPQNGLSTSCGNRYFRNRMGQVPAGFAFPSVLRRYGVPHGGDTRRRARNGVDFWWDEWASNTGNCWYGNRGPDGTARSVTGPGGAGAAPGDAPNRLPDCDGGRRPEQSVGGGDPAKVRYLLACSEGPPATTSVPEERGEDEPTPGCDWYTTPPRPGSGAARRAARQAASAARAFERSAEGARLRRRVQELNAGIDPGLPADGAGAPTDARPVGISSGGSVAQFADCGDWRRATHAERHATIRDIRGQLTPQRSTTAASPLSDERAYAVFQGACAQERFSSLRLYKLYARVQGFAPLAE